MEALIHICLPGAVGLQVPAGKFRGSAARLTSPRASDTWKISRSRRTANMEGNAKKFKKILEGYPLR